MLGKVPTSTFRDIFSGSIGPIGSTLRDLGSPGLNTAMQTCAGSPEWGHLEVCDLVVLETQVLQRRVGDGLHDRLAFQHAAGANIPPKYDATPGTATNLAALPCAGPPRSRW